MDTSMFRAGLEQLKDASVTLHRSLDMEAMGQHTIAQLKADEPALMLLTSLLVLERLVQELERIDR